MNSKVLCSNRSDLLMPVSKLTLLFFSWNLSTPRHTHTHTHILEGIFVYFGQALWVCLIGPWMFIAVQSLSHVRLFATPWTAAHQASLSSTISQSLRKFMFIESVMLSNHLILWTTVAHSNSLCLDWSSLPRAGNMLQVTWTLGRGEKESCKVLLFCQMILKRETD